eukprot:m.13271 g.13271  ORF g.13271 m.13271 type:complete len:115 (-) comp4824_c0_seq1:114-458(-)
MFPTVLLLIACASVFSQKQPTHCNLTYGYDFVGDDLIGANGRPDPQPCSNYTACCEMCSTKNASKPPNLYGGVCTAWSFNSGLKLCFMKNGTGNPHMRSTDVSGVVIKPNHTIY